jgi:hypothetical protein
MQQRDQYQHIKTGIGSSPKEFDVALASIDSNGSYGDLNSYVLKELGYDSYEIEKVDVSKGFYLLNNQKNKPILFIVTVGSENFTGVALQKNLSKAIVKNQKLLDGKTVWVPLMATGAGNMSFVDSYDTIIGVLKKHDGIKFTMAIPDDERGNNFINIFRTDNFQTKAESLEKDSWVSNFKKMNKDYPPTQSEGFGTSKIEDFQENDTSNREYRIKNLSNIVYGKELGKELLNYDVFILPKSGVGGVGQNGIAAKILEIFGFDRQEFRFEEFDLTNRKYKWFTRNVNDRTIYFGFIVTRDENKNKIDFLDQLTESIKALNDFNPIKENSKSKINIFIPFLGTGQAGTNFFESLKKIIIGIQILKIVIPYHRIRINFPLNITESDEKYFLKYLSKQLSGTSPPPGLFSEENKSIFDEIENGNRIELEKTISDKIPFHLDQVVKEDKLGREPAAKAFVRLIKNDIFTDELNHSFMVHLQGKWGAGKSSFLNFIKKNLNSGDEKWIIVEYNAWQNQHIKPPWWSLIDQVYLKSKEQLKKLINRKACFHLWRKEVLRRIWRYSGWQKITAFFLFTVSIICIFYFGDDLLTVFENSKELTKTNGDITDKSFISKLGDFGKLVLTIASLLGTLYGFTKFITIPFFINSSRDAESFVMKASDPMNQVKQHFNDLVSNINNKEKKRQLAIFIDDIDRCDKEFIVQLLEGIQTLFKDKKVLYIVAGDKNWISTSFANKYEEFASENVNKNQLGEFFIQKAFQLSFRLPNISEESKQNYWNHILGMNTDEESGKVDSIEDLSDAQQTEIKSVLKESKSELTNPEFVQNIQEKYNLTGDTASNIVIEEKNKDTEELKHLLQDYHKFIDTNPRSIIRLANNYTMARSILMAERVTFNEHVLFRWLVIEDLCPKVKTIVSTIEELIEFEEIINKNNDIIKRNNCLKLLKGDEEFMEGEITIGDIKTIKGL